MGRMEKMEATAQIGRVPPGEVGRPGRARHTGSAGRAEPGQLDR